MKNEFFVVHINIGVQLADYTRRTLDLSTMEHLNVSRVICNHYIVFGWSTIVVTNCLILGD
jgi:hypothetical protein